MNRVIHLLTLLLLGLIVITKIEAQNDATMAPGEICHTVSDIIFVIDESESIPSASFTLIKNFIIVLITYLDVDVAQTMVRVGIVSYSFSAMQEIAFGDYTDKADLINNKIPAIQQENRATNTAAGLNAAGNELINANANTQRDSSKAPLSEVLRVIMLFSDGLPTQTFATDPTKNQTTIVATRIKDGQFCGGVPLANETSSQTALSVCNPSNLPYPVTIFSIYVPQIDGDAAYMMELSSGSNFYTELSMLSMASETERQAIANAIVVKICYTQTPTPSPTQVPGLVTTPNITVGGDIHFTTLDRLVYTFNGAGDYIYSSSPKYFDLHIRAAMVGKATTLAAIALKDIETNEIIEVWWNGIGADNVEVNIRSDKNEKNLQIDLENPNKFYKVGKSFIAKKSYNLGYLKLQHVKYKFFSLTCIFHGQASFDLNVPNGWKTIGLGGNNNGYYEDDLCDRKNRCLHVDSSLGNRQIHEWALDWKVLPPELLFERWMPVTDKELTYQPLILTYEKIKAAKKICDNVQTCIFDFINVGTKEYALLTKERFKNQFLDHEKFYHKNSISSNSLLRRLVYFYVGDKI